MGLRVGCGTQDITPSGSVALAGHPYLNRRSSGVHDPLQVIAVHLRCDNVGLLLVTLDLLGIDTPTAKQLRQEIAKSATVPEDRVFINCTHTHSGPVTQELLCWSDDAAAAKPDSAYLGLVREKAVFAAAHACATTRPTEAAWTTVDENIDVLSIREEGGGAHEAIVVVCGLVPALLDETTTEISADVPFYLTKRLRAQYGETLTVLFLARPCVGETDDPRLGCCSFEEVEKIGSDMAETIIQSIGKLSAGDYRSEIDLSGRRTSMKLPLRQAMPSPTNAKQRWSESASGFSKLRSLGGDKAAIRAARRAVIEARGILNIATAKSNGTLAKWVASSQLAEVQVVQVGSRYLAGMPGVLFAEYGDMARERSEGKVHPVSLVNGDLQGYIVTPKVESSVRFGRIPSPYDCEAGEMLLNTVFSMISH
jgi:hypothetical protein